MNKKINDATKAVESALIEGIETGDTSLLSALKEAAVRVKRYELGARFRDLENQILDLEGKTAEVEEKQNGQELIREEIAFGFATAMAHRYRLFDGVETELIEKAFKMADAFIRVSSEGEEQ